MATTSFDHTKHKAMWAKIAEQLPDYVANKVMNTDYDAIIAIDDLKYKVLQELYPNATLPLAYCFACEYGWSKVKVQNETADKKYRCLYCPLEGWEADNCYSSLKVITPSLGLFQQLCQAVRYKNGTKAAELATKIKNLSVKEGVPTV